MSWHDANYICSYCLLVPTRGSELADGITFFLFRRFGILQSLPEFLWNSSLLKKYPPLKLTFCLRKWWLEDEPSFLFGGFGLFSVPMLVLGRVTFLAVRIGITLPTFLGSIISRFLAVFSGPYEPFAGFHGMSGFCWCCFCLSCRPRKCLKKEMSPLWSTARNFAVTPQRKPRLKPRFQRRKEFHGKCRRDPGQMVGKWKFGLNHFFVVKRCEKDIVD